MFSWQIIALVDSSIKSLRYVKMPFRLFIVEKRVVHAHFQPVIKHLPRQERVQRGFKIDRIIESECASIGAFIELFFSMLKAS